MEDPKAASFSLPPGFRFYPSEEELLVHYLAGKNGGEGGAKPEESFSGHVRELDLYRYDPFDLPSSASFAYGVGGRKRHWFCYTGNGPGIGVKRRAKSGFWRRRGRGKLVIGRAGKSLGTRTTFVFYLGTSMKTAQKTDWVLYEYAPADRLKDSFVVCRIFIKSHPRKIVSENGLVSCAEESVATVRHIGIQHDDNETSDRILTEPAPILELEFPIYSNPGAQVDMDSFIAQQLLTVLEGDYLELDDLVD